MGQEKSNAKTTPSQENLKEGLAQFQNRFVVSPHHQDNESKTMFLLHQKLTGQRFLLRVICTNDRQDAHKLQSSICRKLANKPNNQLITIDHYIMQEQKTYCNELFRCFLVFKLGEKCSLMDWLALYKANNLAIQEQAVYRGIRPLIEAIAWLKFYAHPHPNITLNSIYIEKESGEFCLEDPWMMVGEQDVQYPSPQKLAKINNLNDQPIDLYLDDLFALGIIGLVLAGIDIQLVYRKGNKINLDRLEECLRRVRNHDLRLLLDRLLGNADERQKLLNEASRKQPRQKIKRLVPRKATQKLSEIRIGFGGQNITPLGSSKSVGNYQLEPKENGNAPPPYTPQPFQKQVLMKHKSLPGTEGLKNHEIALPNLMQRANEKKNDLPPKQSKNQQPMIDVRRLDRVKGQPSPSVRAPSPVTRVNINYRTLGSPEKHKPTPVFHKNGVKPTITIGEPIKQATIKKIQHPTKITFQVPKSHFSPPEVQPLTKNYSFKSIEQREDPENSSKARELKKPESNRSESEIANKSFSQFSESNRPSRILPSELLVQKKVQQQIQEEKKDQKKSVKKTSEQRISPPKDFKEKEEKSEALAEKKQNTQKESKQKTQNDSQDQILDQYCISSPKTAQNKENIEIEQNGKEQNKQKDDQNKSYTVPTSTGRNLGQLSYLLIPEQSDEQSLSGSQVKQKGEMVDETFENGARYQGQIRDGKRNGKGKFYYQDGGYYEGHWKDNQMSGFGKLYYDNQKLAYEGQWYKDQFHGRGKVFNDAPEPLQDEFDYRQMHDTELYWVFYEGDLVHDAKVGFGRIMLSNGEYYEGEFKNDTVHGKGTFHRLDGTSVKGVWMEGQLIKQV